MAPRGVGEMLIMVTEMLVGRRTVLLPVIKAPKSFEKNKNNFVVNEKTTADFVFEIGENSNTLQRAERNISNERPCLNTFPNTTKKRVENTTLSKEFLTNFEVSRHVFKHCLSFLIYHFNNSSMTHKLSIKGTI